LEGHPEGTRTLQTSCLRKSYMCKEEL